MKTEDFQEEARRGEPSPNQDPLWTIHGTSSLVRFLLMFTSGWAAIQLLAYFEVVVVVFVSATILAFLLNHPTTWLSQWLPRGIAAMTVFLSCLVIVVGLSMTLGMAVLSQGQQLAASMQDFSTSLLPWLNSFESLLETWNLPINLQGLEPQLQNQAVTILTTGLGLLQSTLANLVLVILIAVITLFMLLDGINIWWWLLNRLPLRNRERFNTVLQRNL
ncbi:MAG: AI-2E family transporter, partial [Cyanobacteria bacterium J06638_6]